MRVAPPRRPDIAHRFRLCTETCAWPQNARLGVREPSPAAPQTRALGTKQDARQHLCAGDASAGYHSARRDASFAVGNVSKDVRDETDGPRRTYRRVSIVVPAIAGVRRLVSEACVGSVVPSPWRCRAGFGRVARRRTARQPRTHSRRRMRR
ncbi:hypothetical protein C8R43DRAFT_978552 [Mycena crocata]|nr:hypothetical protein C8R43DRAFT_978552 [Mycena crocata]